MKKKILLQNIKDGDLAHLQTQGVVLDSRTGLYTYTASFEEDLSTLKPWINKKDWAEFNKIRFETHGLLPECVLDSHPTSELQILVVNRCEKTEGETNVKQSYHPKEDVSPKFASNLVVLHGIINDINHSLCEDQTALVIRGAGFSIKSSNSKSILQSVLMINKRGAGKDFSLSQEEVEITGHVSRSFTDPRSNSHKVIESLFDSKFFDRFFNPSYEDGEMLFIYTPRRSESVHNAIIQIENKFPENFKLN